jgi:hypothetical protein
MKAIAAHMPQTAIPVPMFIPQIPEHRRRLLPRKPSALPIQVGIQK